MINILFLSIMAIVLLLPIISLIGEEDGFSETQEDYKRLSRLI